MYAIARISDDREEYIIDQPGQRAFSPALSDASLYTTRQDVPEPQNDEYIVRVEVTEDDWLYVGR